MYFLKEDNNSNIEKIKLYLNFIFYLTIQFLQKVVEQIA